MKFQKLLCSLTLFAILAPLAFGQAVPQPKKPTDDPAALRKEAVVFLRETMADVNNLRTLENRISFSAELAGLMWYHDEKEARSLYLLAFGNFKELLMQYDQQMNQFGEPADGEEEAAYRGGMFGDISDRGRLNRRFQTAILVRQQIATSLAEHDAELAFSFYYDTLSAITNPMFRKQMEQRDKYFETELMTQIAQTNAAKAADFAVKSLKDGVEYQHIELLKKIYTKDPEKGAEFAAAMLSKLKTQTVESDHLWMVGSFLTFAGETAEKAKGDDAKKKPLLSPGELRDLTDVLVKVVLDNEDGDVTGMQYIELVEKYNPSRAAQLKAKFKKTMAASEVGIGMGNTNATYRYGNTATNSGSNRMTNTNASVKAEQEREAREKAEKEVFENVAKIGTKQLPKAEREKIVAQARKIIAQTPGRDKKVMALSSLASQVAQAGDKELASELMKEAQALVNPQPKNYQDFLLTWMLATGYAEAEPEKAFPLLEDTILRVNDTLAAFIKVGEFIDVAGEMIDDGEVQLGAFGGQMVRGLTSELGMAENTLRKLAKTDFKKTRDLTSRFDRSEVRILAKMMILRAVLGEGKQAKPEEMPMDN